MRKQPLPLRYVRVPKEKSSTPPLGLRSIHGWKGQSLAHSTPEK